MQIAQTWMPLDFVRVFLHQPSKPRKHGLEKNPLDNIANMRTIQAIYLGGKKFE